MMTRFASLRFGRLAVVGFVIIVALAASWMLMGLPGAAASPESPALTATPTRDPGVDPFEGKLTVVANRPWVYVGQPIFIRVFLDITPGCQYPVYELELKETGGDRPLFDYVRPPTDTVGPPVAMPYTYWLQARTPGLTTFEARAYGERNCDDYWNWTYVYGDPERVEVRPWPHQAWLPAVTGAPK